MATQPLRTQTSPDSMLTLELFEEDDYYLGFVGQAWHTHGDMLVPDYGESARAAAFCFFDAVVSDHEVICISDTPDGKHTVWITDDPTKELKYVEPGETLTMRRWSGQLYQPEEKDEAS